MKTKEPDFFAMGEVAWFSVGQAAFEMTLEGDIDYTATTKMGACLELCLPYLQSPGPLKLTM